MDQKQIAVCGLICAECDILLAKDDLEIAKRISKWFYENRDVEIPTEKIRCDGCRGSRENHWSPDCEILRCCVDKKNLIACYQCEDFPCETLNDWSEKNEKYEDAYSRLTDMHILWKDRN